ncbi:MAG: class I SAM-dependent methyltransferase [Tatlockia sp.]|nr:class I SAM-dependent methyltransferase [Tatlockia sp.]
MKKHLSVGYETESLYQQALTLAESLGLPINNDSEEKLIVTTDKLLLKMAHFSALYSDFDSKTWQVRRDAGKKQGLVRACKPAKGLRIIDATAGWGRDAAVLASFGAEVLMLERQPILAALLNDGLMRQNEQSKKNLKLTLKQVDSKDYLQSLTPNDFPDVIYIDPMHPTRQKAALVKKDMQALQQLFGTDEDAHLLIELARKRALKRIVVKWPQHLSPILKPDLSIEGKVIRFDIWLLG